MMQALTLTLPNQSLTLSVYGPLRSSDFRTVLMSFLCKVQCSILILEDLVLLVGKTRWMCYASQSHRLSGK